ncbi:hypothetical protein [Polaribacter sp. Hel1_85]|uniref:hypothetical protein n=1 Tax=Polaribacter sp. Hel1_85 TaxID=1250005 RepID=UPI00052D4FCD|nr:hypothetical protein [Polaribacter sp. Hel1_85]KGL63942.1 hypothetical protein PHEL85_0984 [Polaribacter sp. Hel1_85]
MKTTTNIILIAILALWGVNTNAQNIQYLRPAGYDGLNVFETKKSNDIEFEKLSVKIGADFAIQFQSVDQSNDMDNLTVIGGNVNLPTANLNFDVQLADGVRMHLRTFLSAKHHNETWVKGGYIQMDKLDFIKKDFLKSIMDVTTLRVGVDQLNYGDAHFRRSDNAMAIYNPFVGNYLMDAYTVEPFVEITMQPKDYLIVAGISNGLLNPTVEKTITPWGADNIVGEKDLKVTFYGKLGIDREINEALRVRLTGSFISESGYNNGDHLYSGDRAGSRYYNLFNYNNSGDFTSSGDFSGRFTPGFKNNTSYQINPFIQYKGLEFFGIYETSKGNKAEGNEKGSFTQLGTELLYRFGEQGQFYVAGRYNSVKGNADYAAGGTKPSDQEINRTNIGAGWFMTKNILMKAEYVKQSYNSDATAWSPNAWTPAILSGAEMNGMVIEAIISF